jgi:plasmid maintenance system antidote protein VapI
MNDVISILDRPTQTLSSFFRELKKVAENRCAKTDTGIKLDPTLIVVEEGYNSRHEGYDSLKEYFDVPENRAWAERMKRAYRGLPGTNTPPALCVQIIDSIPYLRDGHCRNFVINELRAEGFEIKLVDVDEFKGDDEQKDMFILNAQDGQKLSMLAIGAIFARYLKRGWTVKRLAEERGITQNSVNNLVEAYELPQQIKRWIADKVISHTMALDLVRSVGVSKTITRVEEALKVRLEEIAKEQEARRLKEEEKQKQKRLAEQCGQPEQQGGQPEQGDGQFEPGDGQSEFPKEIQLGLPDTPPVPDENTPIVLDGGKADENTLKSQRALLRPQDLKPKALPKKMAESFHSALLDLTSLDDLEAIWEDKEHGKVQVFFTAQEFASLKKIRSDAVQFDNENIKRVVGTVSFVDDPTDQQKNNDYENKEVSASLAENAA